MESGLCAVLEAASGGDYPWAASLASLGRVQDLWSTPGQAAVLIRRILYPIFYPISGQMSGTKHDIGYDQSGQVLFTLLT